jgi:N12 class adenine-specific DNA methylase
LTIDELIDQLQANGYKNHSRAAFKQKLYNSPSFRRELYDANGFKSHGIGYKDFESKLNINNGTIAQSNSEYEEDKRTKSIDDGADKDGQGVIDFAQNVVRHVTDGLMSSSSGLSKAIGNTAISLYGGVTGSDMTNTHAEFNKSMDDARDKLQALMGSPINYISDQIDSDDEDAAAAKSVKRYKEEREAQNKRYELEVWDDTKGVGENIVSLPYKVLSQPVEALSIALSTTGDIFLAKSSVGTRFFGMGVDGAYDELKKINAENPDLHLDDHPNIALGYSASVGVIQGLFEKYSVDKILGPAASKRAANYVLNKAVREITKRGGVITTELLEKEVAAVSRRIGTKVGAAALNTLVATGVEGSEELFTEMGNDAIRIMTNHIGSGLGIDGDIFDIDEMKNTAAERYLTNFAAGAVGGAGLGMTHGLFNNSSDYIRYTYATENNKDEARAQIDSEIQNSRKYSDEMKSALLGYSELMHDMSTKIDNDADIDTKKKMMALLGSKSYQISKVQSLEQKIATIDDSLKEAQQPLLDREKAKLAHINNVILATYKGNDLVYNEKDGQYTKTIGDETSTISELEYMIGSVAQLQDKRKDGDATDDEDGSFADDDADLISDLTRGVEAVSDIPVEVIKPLDVGTKIEYNGVRGEVVEIDRLKDGSIRSIKLKDDDGNDTFVFINGKDIEEYGIQIISDENTRQTNDDGSVGEENQSEAQTEDGGISEGESTITAVEGEPSDIGIADDDGSTKEGQKEQEPLYKSDPGYVSELEKEHSRLTKERDEYISDIAELKAIDPTFDENGEETAKAQRIYDDGIKNAEEKARTNSINKRRDADIKKAKDIGKRKGIDVTKTIENINKKYDEELGENQKENEVGHTKVSRVLDSQIDDENFPRENIESHPIFQSNARKAKESKGRAEGKAFKKTLANGEVITGKYILINKNDVFASHRAHSFSKTPGVPVNKNGNTFNDNDYERSKTAQAKQIKDANNYDQRAIEDPVLIDRNGVVKSGNGRTISRQMSNAKSSQKYTNELKERAEEFGFTKEQVEAIGDEDVMLAVELDGDPVYTTKEYAKYNEDSTKKKTPTEDAIVKAKSLDEKTISQMASVFEDSDVMSDLSLSDIDRLRNILINNGVISETNQSLYFDENGKLTASGSELIENILLASIFNENEIRTLSKLPSIRKKLAQNRVRLLNNRRKEETSVINLVRRAISIIGLSTSYSGSFEDKIEQYITQSDMFDVVDSDKDVVLMAILINDASKFRQLLDSLNNIVEGEDLFGNTIDSASVLSSVYDMVHDELSDKQKLVLEKAGYNINIEEYEKQEEGNETVSDKGKDGLTSGRQEGNIGTVSDGKNKSETGGKENDRKKEGVDEVDRGKDISYESDTSSKKKDSTEDVVNKDVKEAEEVGKDEKDKKTEASDSTDFEATDKKLADKIKKIDDEIDDIWADFNKLGISLTPEQQAENMAKAVRLMALYAQKGVYKLAQIINDAIKHFGRAKTEEFLPFLKKAYLASQSEVEDDIIDKFDDVKSVRNFKILDDVSGIDTNRENNNVKIQEDESKEVNNKGHGASGSFMDRTREIVEQGSLFGDDEVGGIIRSGEGKRGEVSQGRGGDERSVPSGRSRGDSKEGTLSGTVRLTNNVPIPGTIEPQQSPKKNYEPKSIDAPRTFNIKSHFEDNNTAIRTLLSIIKDGDRLATEAEKEILAKYVGWGGIKAVNRIEGQAWSNADMPYKELFGELVELTKGFEAIGYSRLLNDISKSTLNAHYTGTDVIEGIYSALEHLGFKGGNILEPSAGIGNFIGFAPKNIMNNSSVTAIELDRLTGKILEKLYPSASTFIKGYEEVSMPLNGFDLIVSNIPFGNYGVATSRNDSPIVKKASKKIHNYFFAKALEQVKDGGIIAFVTSTGVMDSKGNEFLRQYISENAWFIGAIRLPNKTFKGLAGTSVTTDIIFLKKTASPISNTDFIGTSDVEINGEVLSINNYFKENPNHVIGEYTIGRLYGGKQIAVEYKGENSIYDEISSIVKKWFPKNIVSATQSIPQSHAHATVTNIEPNTIIYDKDGSYFITDAGIKRKIANKHQAKVPSFIRLRDILKEQYRLEASPNVKDEEIEANRALLNKEYDNYVSNFGALNTQDNKPFVMSDVFGYNLLGSELKDKDSNRYHKADIFKKRVINKNNRVDIADNLGDAISISINETGAIDIKRLASLLNVKEETLVEDYYGELFYDSDGTVVDREAYLSGNVKKKYKEAVSLSESNPIYNKNVEALEKVIPKDIPIELIDINIGARFVPIEYYRDFATFIFNTQVEASYNRILDQYKFKGGNSANVNLLYGTSRIDGYKLLEHALHGSRPTIYDKIDESTTIVNQEETQLAIEKLEEIERVFRNWIVSDGNRASVLKRIYNDAFNTTIKREFSPKGFSINGSNSAITLADHQVSAIKMLVTNRGGIIDHIVGAGKTFLMISAAMKMKQLGIANKPTIIGLKSTIQDLVSDAKKLFPTASILSPSENDFSAQNRKSFLAKIQNNDWDIIIMSHEQFGYIPQDNEFQQNIIQQEIEEIEQALLQSAGDTGPSKQQLSGLIKRKENLTKKLSELSSRDIDKEVINFRNIGIDHLFVDESQYFKNLQYTTRINRVSGLGNPIGSKRSYNMLTAIRTLQAKNGGDKGVTFLSGTPISNSLVEMYLLLKYLRPTKLEELGYRTFDSWVKQFATQSSQMEFTVSGSVKLKNRFREFVNIPELSILYNEIADIRNDNNLKLPKPVIRGGSPQLIAVKQSDEQLEWTDRLIEFSNQKHGDRDGSLIGKPNMSESQQSAAMLLVTNISNKLSVDLRLVDKNSPFNPDGKLAAAANVIKEEYDKSSGIKGTQLIFSDIGTPKSGRVMDDLQSFLEDQLNVSNDDINLIFGEANDEGKRPSRSISKIKENIKEILEYTDSQIDQIIQDSKGSKDDFNAYSELRRLLIQHGIPESEIAFIHDYKTKKQREKLFKAVNEGSIRVVIGSTQKLGTGVNIQQRIVALHHIDAKWNPADMEQRNGRGIRQKNMNKEVAVYNYGTERTLDAYKYQLISTKQKFINQVKSGALSEDRYALEEDGEDLAASSITAILSGNPLLFEKAKTDSEVEKLRRSQRAFIAQQSNIDSEIEALEHSIPNQQKFIEKRVKDIDTTKANTMTNKDGELKPTWVIDGKRVDDNDTRVSLVKAKTDTVRNAEPGTTVLIGKVGGLQYIAQKVHNENAGLFTSDIQYKLVGGMEYKSNTLPFNAIEKLPADLEKAKTFLEKSKKDLESLKEKENRVWDKQNELDQKIIKQKQINDSLANQNEEASLSQDKKNVSRGEVGLGFKEILQRTPLSNDSKKVLQFILKKFPYIANNVDFIEDQKVWDDLVGSDEYGGWYATDDETGRIVILLNPKKKAGRDETILHEVIHAFTQTIIDNPRTAAEREYVAQITELYNKFKSIKGVSQTHAYIYDDIHEFVTYTMTNTPFQRFLRNRLSTRSLFDKVIDAIRNMFGFPSNDIVNKVISSTKAIISTTDYSNIQERILDGYRAQKGAKIDISTQGSNKTNKVYETKVETKSGKGETVQFKSSQGNNDYTSSDNIQREGDKVKSSGIGRTIAGVWNKFKNIQFTGTTKVKNAADVAHIMRLLEDKSVEHAFAVHIDSKGNSHIQFLSIGGISGTVVDPNLVLSGVAKFKSKKVYLVHNHPSGNMTPSNADRNITKNITEGLSSLTTEFEHIIMDTYKQEYLVLDKYGYTDGRFTREKREEGRKLSTHIFDGAKVLTEPLAKITSSSDVAEFLYQKRFSVLPKNGYLILNQQNNIIGNFSFKGDVNVNELLLSFGETATAKSVIMYGNSAPLNLNKISVQLNKLDVGLLDYVEVKGGGNDVKGAYDYISAADSGLLNEVQAKYGTNMVNEPVNDSSESQPITEAESKTLTDWLNKAFGGAVRVLGLDAFNARAKELGVKPIDIKYPDGTVYGAVLPDGSMYLNPKKINANTPIHEHTHLFNQVIQKTNPKLWDKIVEATKKTELWEEVKNDPNYANLKTDSQIADEVFSRFVGDKGEGSWQERIAKADSKSRLAKVGELIKEYWNAIKEFFGVDIYKGMTADDFANMTLDKLFSGKEIKGAEEAIGVKDDKSVVKKMMIGGKEVEVKTLPQVTNGFYSPIEKKLLDEKATNLSATKWLERLGKGDEMQFTGLKDFLESKKPNEQVKKSDIQDFMRDNRIEVVEVVKLDRPFREIKKAFENVGNEWEEVYGGVYAKLSDKSNEYERRYNLKINGVEYGRDFTYLDAKSYVEANAQTNPEKNRSKFSQYQLEGQKENYKEIMIVLPREGSMKKVGDYTVPSAHKYGEDLADNRRVVHLRMNTRTDADGNKVLFLEEVQSDHNQEARKKGVRNEKEMKRISELADLFLEDRTKNQEGTPERIEYEKLTARNNTQGVPDAPFIKDTNATTKLGLKVALKEAVAQGADKISWTTGEQQNERYDLSKQVDEIGWQKNENGTYNITPKKDGSVIGTREMMANLTIKQIEDYVGKEVAEKIQNEEGKVWDGGSVKQGKLTGQQLKVGGKGMIGFYGNPSEGKLGIVGQVAKSLFKQEPQTIELQNTVTLSGNQNKILRFRDWVWANETKDYSFADAEKDIENNNELYAKYQSSIPTQHAITITPEMRQQVQEGLPLFNVGLDVARFMVKSQLKSDKVMFNISDKYWNDLGKVVNDAKNVEDLNNALDIISDAIFQKYSKKRAVISNNRVRAQVRMLQSTNPREMATVISNAGVMFKTDADDYSEGDLEKLKKPAEDMLTKSRIDIGQKWNEVLKNYPSSVRYLVYRGIYKFISKESEAYPIGYIKEAFDSTIQRFSESDSPQNFDFYTEYNQSIIDLLGEDRDSVINVDTDNGISGTWIKMNKASDSNDIEATKIKVAAASNGTSWCTKQTDTSGTGAKKVIEEDDHDFYVFFPKNTTQATIAIVPIREGEEEQLVNNSWYTGVFKQSNASDNNVDPEYYETVNQLAKKTKDKDLAYTLEKIGYSGLSKEEIKEIQRQKDKVKLDWFENHSGEIFTDEDIEDINRIYGISIIVNGDQLGLHEWTEGIEEQLPESIRKDFGNKLFKSISYIELDANFNGSQVQSLGNLQSIGGNAYFKGSQVQSLGNLQSIGGYANFNGSPITSLGNLQSIGGNAYFEDSQVQSLGNLQSIGGNAYFNGSQVQSLGNLQSIGGYANFNDSQVQSLGILQSIGGYAYFEGSQVQSLGNLQSIGGYAYFNGSQVQSLGNLQSIGGNANFNGSQVQSLGNLQSIGGHAYFNGSQVQSLGNLQSIGGNAYFKGSQVQSLGNLQSIGEYAYFEDSQVQSLGNLQSIGGNAYFKDSQVQSLGNLQSIGGNAYFNGSQVQSLGNLQSIGEYAYFEDSQVQSLGNLQSIGGNAYFNGSPITSLGNLQSIGGNAYFEDSQVQSLGNLQSIGGYANFNDSQVQSLGNLQSIGGDADFMDSKKNIFRLLKTGDNVAKEKALRIKDIFTNAHYSYLANLKNGGDIKLFNDFLPAEFRLRREEIDVNLSHNSDEIRFSMSESAVNQADKAATVGNTDPIGKVVINLNKSGATKEAQIKEFASAWITVMQRQSASFINRGLELVADTEYIKETRGDAMLALQNAIADHTSKLKKTDKLIGWVKSFWVRVGKMLRINISSDRLKEMTIGEFLDIASAQLRYTNDIISELLADSTSDNKAIETEGKKSEENYREESISEREKKLLDEYESLIANMDNEGGKSDTRQNNMSIEEEYDFIGRDLSDNTQALVRTNGKEYDSMLQSLVGSAKKVVETIAFLMPTLKNAGISVTLHKSTSSYYNAVANNGGSAIEATRSFAFYKDGQIHINIHKPGIKANVAIHEALHPIIRDLLVNNKPVFDRFVNDILNDKELRKKYYDDFAMARYSHLDGDKISEEAIIEASADIILARIIKGLDAASDSVFNRVLKYIKEALGKTYGKLFEHVNTRADFNAFANTLADGISKGMVISFNREGKAAIKEIVENAASIADGNNTKNITGEKVDNDDAINNKKQASGLSQSIQDNRSQQKRAIQSKLTADILTNPDINWEHIASKLVTSGVLTKDEVDDILNGWRQKNASVNTVGKNMSSDQTLMAIEGMAELLHLRNMTEDDDVRITHEAMDELVANLDGELSDSLLHYTPYEVKATIKRIADSGLAHPVNILQIFHNVINSGNVPGHEKFIAMGIAISQLKSSLKKYKDIYKKTGDKHSADMVDSINDMLLRLAAASKTASSLSGAALGIHSKLIELGGLTYEGQLIELDGINKRGKNIEIEESDKKQINALVNKINELQAALDKAITSNETKNDGDKEKETTYRTIRKVNAGKQPILSKEVLLAKLRKLRASSTSFSLAMSVSDPSDMSYNEIIVELIKVAHIDGAVTFKDVVEAVKGYDNQITENDIYNAVISQTHESKAKRLSELAQREATTKRHARDIARLEKMIKDDIAALLVNNKVPDTNRMHSIRKLLYDIEKNIYSIDTTGSIMATQQNAIDQIRDNYDIAFLHPSPDKSTEDMLSSIVNAIRMLHDAKYKAWIEETYRNLKKEIDNINEAIKNGTFAKTVSPSNDTRKEIPTHISVPVFDDDGEVIGIDEQEFNYGRILRDISTMRREIEAIKNKYRNSESAYHKWYVRFRNTIGGSMAMMDLSYFAVQGYRALTLFWRNPKMFIQAFSKSISVMADEFSRNPGKADIIYKQIVENPYYQRAVSLGLVISDPEAHIHIKEEIGGDDYFDIIYDKTKNKKGLLASTINVPLKIRKKVKTASNASFATHLNLISINTVSAYIERVVSKTGEQPSDKELEAIIRDVNNSTGRPHFKQGSHGGKIAVGASYVLWAPKLYASQIFNIANIALDPIKLAYYASRGEKDMTRAYMYKAANSVLAFATTTAVIYGLRAMLAKIQCGDNVGYNTEKGTSRSNWMKIQCGDWSFDPTGNHRQWIRLGYNLIKTVQNEPPVDYRGEKISPSQQIFNVLRYKSNPALAFVSSLFTGTDFMNRRYYADDTSPMQIKSRVGVIKDAFIPIFGNNLVDLYKFAMSDNSERLRLKPLVAVEQVLGFGVTYIDPKEKEERKEIEKKEKADSKKEKSEDALQKLIKEGLPKEYSEGEFQDNVDWSNISLTDKQYKSKDGKRRQVFRHISDTNHDGKENDCFVWRTRIRGKRKGEKYKERVPCE